MATDGAEGPRWPTRIAHGRLETRGAWAARHESAKGIRALVAVAVSLLLSAGPVLAEVIRPSGSVVIQGGSVRTRRGPAWAAGRLIFKGEEYTFEIRGLEGAEPDVTGVLARGEVYGLKDVREFSGMYRVADAREAFGDEALTLIKNGRVRVRLVGVGPGAKLTVAATGIEIAVEQ